MEKNRSIVYIDDKWNHWILYPWVKISSDTRWKEWSPQEVSEKDLKSIQELSDDVTRRLNAILSNYL